MGMSILLFVAAAYIASRGDSPQYQLYTALGGAIVTLIWGGYYTLLRYELGEQGICKRILRSQRYSWEEIGDIELEEKHNPASSSLSVYFTIKATAKKLRISSELLGLEAMEDLIADLRESGKLPPSLADAE